MPSNNPSGIGKHTLGKYMPYVLIAAVLMILAVVLFLKDKSGTLQVNTDVFSVKDTSSIATIKLSDGKNMILLERSGNHWRVDRQFTARTGTIKALLRVLMNLEIKSPVANSLKKAVMNNFGKKAVTVSIESDNKTINAYQITEDDSLRTGSYMMLKGNDEAYLMQVPGFNGRISMLFPCDLQFWRDKTIFKYSPADVLSVSVSYPSRPKASFVYQFVNFNTIEVRSGDGKEVTKIGKETARAYLLNFASVPYEAQVKHRAKQIFDSLHTAKPYCQIQVKTAENEVNVVRTYQIPVQSHDGKFDLNRMYAVHQNDTVPVYVKYADFDPIMKEYADFSTH